MKSYKVEIKVGDYIEVGRFRNVVAKVKSIELSSFKTKSISLETGG